MPHVQPNHFMPLHARAYSICIMNVMPFARLVQHKRGSAAQLGGSYLHGQVGGAATAAALALTRVRSSVRAAWSVKPSVPHACIL